MALRLVSLDDAVKRQPAASFDPAEAAFQRGFEAGNVRIAAVMDSAPGKANPFAAAFMLLNSDASAEAIIAWLPKMAPVAGASFKATTAEDPLQLWREVQGHSENSSSAASASDDDPWMAVQGGTWPPGSH